MSESRWFDFDQETKEWTFQGTEDHIFGTGMNVKGRIGDMERLELIAVLATVFDDRENLALALITAVHGATSGEEVNAEEMGIGDEYSHAGIIVGRAVKEG